MFSLLILQASLLLLNLEIRSFLKIAYPNYLSVDNLAMGREGEHVATVEATAGADEKDPIRGPVWKECQVCLLPAQCWPEPGFTTDHCGKWLVCPL